MARVLWIGTFDPQFSRNRKLARLLEMGGHEVDIVNRSIWGQDRYEIMSGGKARLAGRAAVAYFTLAWHLVLRRRADVVLISYPGWFDALLLGPLARIRRMPIVFDVFISLRDTAVSDRGLTADRSLTAKAMGLIDRWSMGIAGRVIADTPAHASFFAEMARLNPSHVDVVWVGADDRVFVPCAEVEPEDDLVLFYGTLIGLQGIETIVRAAKLVESDGVRVRIIGTGQERATLDSVMAEVMPTNVELVAMVPLSDLPAHITSAALCLGIFGTSAKAARVLPHKLYEALAVGRPVVTADTPAIVDALAGDVAVVPAGDARALADAIRELLADPDRRAELARRGHERYLAEFHETALSGRFEEVLADAVSSRRIRIRRRSADRRLGTGPLGPGR